MGGKSYGRCGLCPGAELGAHEVSNPDVLFGLPPAAGEQEEPQLRPPFPSVPGYVPPIFVLPLFPCSRPQRVTALRPSHRIAAVLQHVGDICGPLCICWSPTFAAASHVFVGVTHTAKQGSRSFPSPRSRIPKGWSLSHY